MSSRRVVDELLGSGRMRLLLCPIRVVGGVAGQYCCAEMLFIGRKMNGRFILYRNTPC